MPDKPRALVTAPFRGEGMDLLQSVADAISNSGEAHMPTTRIHDRTSLRVCFLHYENDESDVEHLIGLVRRLGAELAGVPAGG